MAEFVVHVGSRSTQGRRPNNEDRYVADASRRIYLVADGMGGQEQGEQASGMAADLIPRLVQDRLVARDTVAEAIANALAETNRAIVDAGQDQPRGKRMGTTAVVAVEQDGQMYVASVGDSRAYLVHDGQVEQLTVDHSVAQSLVASGALTPEEAQDSPWHHVLYRFLGCAEMTEGADVRPFTPRAGDRLLLASDGLTNHITEADLRDGAQRFPVPQDWVDQLVELALERGSTDNVTCVVVAFDGE